MQRGTIVKSKAGRDKETFLVVLEVDALCVKLADGKKRPLENPKLKKIFHTAPTKFVLNEESLLTNKKIRTALRNFRATITEVI